MLGGSGTESWVSIDTRVEQQEKALVTRSTFAKSLIGPAGEHYVMFQIYLRGFLAALAPHNYPDADVMVVGQDGAVSALVQVKTRTSGKDGGWHMRDKHEELVADHLFYCFVDLEPSAPVTCVVPSALVAQVVRESHQAWLSAPPKRADKPHKDNPMRRIMPEYGYPVPSAGPKWMDAWRERWELLAPGSTAPGSPNVP